MRGSEVKGRKAGVLTLIRKNLLYDITHTDKDDEGRRVTITMLPRGQLAHTAVKITNLYAPNLTPKREYFQTLGDWFYNTTIENYIMEET